jgi:PAS domain S-box-containing protein
MNRNLLAAEGGANDMLFRFGRRTVLSAVALAMVIGAIAAGTPAQPEAASRFILATLAAFAALTLALALYAVHVRRESRRSETIYRAIVGLSQEGICVVDEHGRFAFANARFAAMLLYEPAELVGRRVRDFVDPREHDAFEERFEQRRRGRKDATTDVTLVRADGSLLPALSTTTTFYDGGRLRGVMCMLTDRQAGVGGEGDTAEDLTTAHERVQTFTYSVSHDLRAPLRAIDGFARELQLDADSKLSESGARYLERILAASERMRVTIDALLDLSSASRRPLRREHVDLSAIASAAAAELADGSRAITFEIAPRLEASGDPHLLRIVFDNLLGNAVKFTARKPAAHIAFGCTTTQNGPAYFVRDDGAGFDLRYSAAIFAPFQRLHPSSDFEGSGIGLATVQRIIHRHGGRIWVDASPGAGATFYFTLAPPEATSP